MTMRDVVRQVVVRTNPYWPFSALNRVPYRLAVEAITRRMRNREDVRGLYLRNGLLGSDWVPGISDIDLTLVTDDMDVEHEYRTLAVIWAQYDLLKGTFPMLGELDILTTKTLPARSRFAVTGYETRFWKPLVGDRPPALGYDGDPLRLQFDAVNHAVLVYFDFLLPRLVGGGRSRVAACETRRIAWKVVRYAALASAQNSDPTVSPDGTDPSVAAAAALAALDRAVHAVDFSSVWAASPAATPLRIDGAGSEVTVEDRTDYRLDLSGRHGGIDAVVTGFRAPIVVLKEGLRPADMVAAFQHMAGDRRLAASQPMVVTPAVFRHIVRFYEPFLYTHLLAYGRVAFGGPVTLPPAPHERAFAYSILMQVQNVFSAARSRGVLPQYAAAFIGGGEFELAAERALFTKTLLECGMVSPWYDAVQAECRRRYGDDAARVAEIRQRTIRDERDGGIEAFALLRDLARDLAVGVEDANVEARVFRRVNVEHEA